MKKVFTLIAIAAVTATFVACGPSKEDLEKAEKAKQDSIAMADSIANADAAAKLAEQAKADSVAMVEQAKADSTRIADSIAALKPSKKK
ncbi:MAG: hypothetical protein ACOVLD_05380 [Bacteroidia bacterium]|jgi:mRNA-degrading endonuclease toxin of MazEF toxin-antitoxin module